MNSHEPKVENWRLKLGAGLFGLSILLPLAGVPLVAWFNFSTRVTATITGGLLVAAEVMGLAAVAVMGKSGYALIKKKLLSIIEQYGPPNKVSRLRYRIGLVMFCTPIVFGWVSIYTARWIPGFESEPFLYRRRRRPDAAGKPLRAGRRFLGQDPLIVCSRRRGALSGSIGS
jgi:hypothetical protein